jgi:hypothetical protein
MALTNKQLGFCRDVASGSDYITAYKNNYNWSGSDNAAQVEAVRLAGKTEVQDKIKALRQPYEIDMQRTVINERQKQIDFIKSRIAHCQQTEDENSLIRWSDQLNKILGIYKEDIKTEAPESTVSRLDTDTLLKIAGSVQ